MNWLQKIAYGNEISLLNRYLRQGFDPYDYFQFIPDFLVEQGIDEFQGKDIHKYDPYELGEKWLATASEKDLEKFEEEMSYREDVGEYHSPSYETMDYLSFVKPTWLIHFTDDPRDIAQKGFQFGHNDLMGLHLTTHKTDRYKEPGYNFAYPAKKVIYNSGEYGRHAVIFWGSGVKVWHNGDEEIQIIVWGPSVKKDMLFPIYSDGYSQWVVETYNGRILKKSTLENIIEWVINNYRMLQQIREKGDL